MMIDIVDELGDHGKEDWLEIVESLDVVFGEVDKLSEILHSFPEITIEQVLVVFFIARIGVFRNVRKCCGGRDIIVVGGFGGKAFVWRREGRGAVIPVWRRGAGTM